MPIEWGVFDSDGNLVIWPDSVLMVDYKGDSRLSDYPVEQGAFASYNKVQAPYTLRTRISCGGQNMALGNFLQKLDDMKESLDLYSFVTPEKAYLNANLQQVDYKREARDGVSMVTADCLFFEVRVTGSIVTQTATASSAPTTSVGRVNTASPTTAQSALMSPLTVN